MVFRLYSKDIVNPIDSVVFLFFFEYQEYKTSIFGICFILYFLKLSASRGFWYELRKNDPHTHKQAVAYQRCLRRKQKTTELDHASLLQCTMLHVYPKFIDQMKEHSHVA